MPAATEPGTIYASIQLLIIDEVSEAIAKQALSIFKSILEQKDPITTDGGQKVDLSAFKGRADEMIKGPHLNRLSAHIVHRLEEQVFRIFSAEPNVRKHYMVDHAREVVADQVARACAAVSNRPTPNIRSPSIRNDIKATVARVAHRMTFSDTVKQLTIEIELRMHEQCPREVERIMASHRVPRLSYNFSPLHTKDP